jgi:hypothetical protein
MAKTLCPNCGFSPIPSGADECPECQEPFAFLQTHKRAQRRFVDRDGEPEDNEVTIFGGNVTSEVSARPGPAMALLFAGAVAWFLRVGVLGELRDPSWVYGLVVLDMVLALLLMLNLGPAKVLTQVGLLAQLGVTAWLGRAEVTAPVHLAFGAHALLTFILVTGEAGAVRRYACLGLGFGAAAAALVLLVVPVGARQAAGPERQKLVGRELGFELELPMGWGRLEREQLEPHLVLPAATLTGSGVAFGNAAQGRYGVLWVDRKAGLPLISGCQDILKAVGGGAGKPLSRPAPGSLGSKALVYELRTVGGAQGALGCGQLEDGRLVGLAVVASEVEGGEAAFAAVGAGLALQ